MCKAGHEAGGDDNFNLTVFVVVGPGSSGRSSLAALVL